MQHAGARTLREDDYDHTAATQGRRLRVVGAVDYDEPPREDSYVPQFAENGRRTVKITGRPGQARRRPSPTHSQIEARPDRIALWAFLLGLFLVFMAVATANASPL
jgi:hypothetical protein